MYLYFCVFFCVYVSDNFLALESEDNEEVELVDEEESLDEMFNKDIKNMPAPNS